MENGYDPKRITPQALHQKLTDGSSRFFANPGMHLVSDLISPQVELVAIANA